MRLWKLGFGILGLVSLFFIVRDYGFATTGHDLSNAGWRLIPLALTFFPTLLCYTMVWFLVTERPAATKTSLRKRMLFFAALLRITVIAIAWNNLSPFVKVLGEPIRLNELTPLLGDQRRALKSLLAYNLTHMMGTVLSFIVGALTIPFLFNVSDQIKLTLFIAVFVLLGILTLFWLLPYLIHRGLKLKTFKKLRRPSLWLRWSVHKIRRFYAENYWALTLALLFSVSARFIEGLTFYYAFILLSQPLPLLCAAYLDVGRALADNIFFFVPYQLGSREYAVGFLLENVFKTGLTSFVSAALLYRLVEIFWMLTGYLTWGIGQKKSLNK